jgi:Domain of unknown function (DUF6438)
MKRAGMSSVALALVLMACGDGRGPSTGDDRGSLSAELPKQPANFRIELAGSACFGTCPTYNASIDQDGNVSFTGERCVAQPGTSSKRVPAEDARAIYDALRATKFATLGDRYLRTEDGCSAVATDHPTSTWKVAADEFEKSLVRYHGCMGVAGLPEVDAVEAVFQVRAAIDVWLEPPSPPCR